MSLATPDANHRDVIEKVKAAIQSEEIPVAQEAASIVDPNANLALLNKKLKLETLSDVQLRELVSLYFDVPVMYRVIHSTCLCRCQSSPESVKQQI
jgi:hypothetical protein